MQSKNACLSRRAVCAHVLQLSSCSMATDSLLLHCQHLCAVHVVLQQCKHSPAVNLLLQRKQLPAV